MGITIRAAVTSALAAAATLAPGFEAATPHGAGQAQTPVPVHEEPRHRLVFEHESVRILDVRIPPGDTTLYHVHDAPVFYVALGVSRTRSQVLGGDWVESAAASPLRVGAAFSNVRYALEPVTHRVGNIGDDVFRLLALINRRSAARRDTIMTGRRPAVPESESGLPEVESESAWFASYRWSLEPAAASPAHRHRAPVVVVQLGGGAAAVIGEGGEETPLDEHGGWTFREAGTLHTLENRGGAPLELFEIEIR